jgi:hypothetical protein
MQAHAGANLLGNTYDRKPGEAPQRAQVHVLRHKESGKLSTMSQFYGKARPETPEGHEIVYTALSEGLKRSPLLAEGVSVTSLEPSRQPPLISDDKVREKLKTATGDAAARLSNSLKWRAALRDTAKEPTDTSEAPTAQLRTVDPNAKTNIMRPPGHRTEVLRPPGHKTQVALNTVQQRAPTAVLPVPKMKTLDAPREAAKTQNLRAQRIVSSVFYREPLLQEFVTNSFLSKFPAGTRISGAPGVQGVTDTSNIGLVSAQGGVVPDKKKRDLKIPKPEELPKGRDPITKQLERQPSNAGMASPLLGRLSRTEQAMAEHCGTEDVWAITSSRNGYGIVDPKDDHVGLYRQFRESCPDTGHIGHAAFCSRCDNSYPTRTGGVDWLTRTDWKKLSPTSTPEDPYKIRGNSTGE